MGASWRWIVLGGAVALAAVVAWQLFGSSYKSDIQIICHGEEGSGVSASTSAAKVQAWISAHVATAEGTAFWNRVSKEDSRDRGGTLRDAAKNQGITSCPYADALDKLAADDEYRRDIGRLCNSTGDIHSMPYVDDDARTAKLAAWGPKHLTTPRAKELLQKVLDAAPADRAKIVRDAASAVDQYQCPLADVVSAPVSPPPEKTAVVTFSPPEITGAIDANRVSMAIGGRMDEIKACYAQQLERVPGLEGKLLVHIAVLPSGKVSNAQVDGTPFDPPVAGCVTQVAKSLDLPRPTAPTTTVAVTFEFKPKVVAVPTDDTH
jgi:hypothetical protein